MALHSPYRTTAQAIGLAVQLLWAATAQAAYYYVDADLGNDSNNGLSSVPGSNSTGPWRSLSQVGAATLQAGDTVLLRCGQTWNETLNLLRGGTAGKPLTVSSYPTGCTNKPAISGWMPVQSDDWQRYSGNIYKLTLPFNLVPNGSLSTTIDGWTTSSSDGTQRLSFDISCPGGAGACGVFASGTGTGRASSPSFAIKKGRIYTVRMRVQAPAGAPLAIAVRRNVAPFALQSKVDFETATGNWQDISFQFTAAADISDARVDINLPGGGVASYLQKVRVEPDLGSAPVLHVGSDIGVMNPASFPNIGFNSANPNSPYLSAGVSTAIYGSDGRRGSQYITTGSDLALPPGASLAAGQTIWVRSANWSLKQHTITAVIGSRVYIDPLTAYPLTTSGWGYFFTGALWMLDSPGEWFYDSSARAVYAWMPDSGLPATRIKVGMLDRGVRLGNPDIGKFPGYITLDNLAIRGVGTGVQANRMVGVVLKNMLIEDTSGMGIYAEGADGLNLVNSVIRNTRTDAAFIYGAADTRITDNDIINSGVRVDANGKLLSLPRENFSAVMTGPRALVSGNRILDSGYISIQAGDNAIIQNNAVRGFAWLLNDSGGIYSSATTSQVISGNLITGGLGNIDGIPAVLATLKHAPALYLDDQSKLTTIRANYLGDSEWCAHFHDASQITFESNSCFGARRDSLWLQETAKSKRAEGDVWGNTVRSNAWFHTSTSPVIHNTSNQTEVNDFGLFDGNAYSIVGSPIVVTEETPSTIRNFTLQEWQRAKNAEGSARNLEVNGGVRLPTRQFAPGLLEASLLPAFDSSPTGGWFNYIGGSSTSSASCGPNATTCVSYRAPTTGVGLFSSRGFKLVKGRRYRVSFDASTEVEGQTLTPAIRRNTNPQEVLMNFKPLLLAAGTQWRRYSFTFKATVDVDAPPNASGARMDFMNIPAGSLINVANIEIAPYSDSIIPDSTITLYNVERAYQSYACPDAVTKPSLCGKYFEFPSGARVSWPLYVAPRTARMLFTQDDSYLDSDGDGIPDRQDQCPATILGSAVNGRGCALNQ